MKEVILLGRGPSWEDCPFDGEVWATASCFEVLELRDRAYSKIFAFDPKKMMGKFESASIEMAKSRNIPVVSTKGYATEPFPAFEIIAEFHTDYLKNSVSYMIAYALHLGYQHLRLYGIDQGPEWDYIAGKPYVMFWLGVATGRGVSYEVARTSILKKYERAQVKKRFKELKDSGNWKEIVRYSTHNVFLSGHDMEAIKVNMFTPK